MRSRSVRSGGASVGTRHPIAVVAGFVAAIVFAFAGFVATADPAAAANSAVVVVDTGAGHRSVTVTFTSSSISGLEALELAGANPVVRAYGPGLAVCQLDGVGHTQQHCLGTPSDARYWVYFRAAAGSGAWTYSSTGAGQTTVKHGDWEGWRFGTGQKPAVNPPTPKPPPTAPPSGGGGGGGTTPGGGAPGGGAPGAVDPGGPGGSGGGGADGGSGAGAGLDGVDGEAADDTEADGAVDDSDAGEGDDTDVNGDDEDAQVAGAFVEGGTSGSDGGSPLGLVAVLALTAALVTAAVVTWRRRLSMRA